jgi:phosphodiesterase/alkaline phosphatase D-like protein
MITGAAALALMLAGSASLAAQPLMTIPYVGAVTDSSAAIVVWCRADADVILQVRSDSSMQSFRLVAPAARDSVFKVVVRGMPASTRHTYELLDTNGVVVSEGRSFETYPTLGVDAPVSFFFGSCQQSRPEDVGRVFDVAASLGGDLFVQMGDWAYPDIRVPGYPSTDSMVRASYVLRLDTAYPFPRRVLSQMPIAYIWDDHDSFGNNSDGASPAEVKTRVKSAYETHVPHYPLANPTAGIWQSLRLGNVELFLLDSRSQRSPIDSAIRGNQFIPPPGHSLLAGFPVSGIDQLTWLLDGLRNSTARWKVIVSPVPFNPGMEPGIPLALLIGRPDIAEAFGEYFAGYPADIDSLTSLLRTEAGRNTIIVSGSAHTNMFDDGTHSIVPEFVAANLDIGNSNLRDTLARYGLNVWTAGQTGTNSTVGRIRVETTPAHRLIVESFDEDGALELQYVMVDSSGGSGSVELPDAASRGVHVSVDGRTLRVDFERRPIRDVTVELYDVGGRLVLRDRRGVAIDLPEAVAAGTYIGRVDDGDGWLAFRVVVR